jgi:hypothetical protein
MDNRGMDTATIILTSVLINGLFILVIQSWIKTTFAKELETHKDKLARLTEQNNFRYSQVFNKTEEKITTIYCLLLELKDISEGIVAVGVVGEPTAMPPHHTKSSAIALV